MAEQPLPERYLGYISFLDRQSGRASGSSDTALALSLDRISQDVWFTTFERMLTILLSLPRCTTPENSNKLYGSIRDFNARLDTFVNATYGDDGEYDDDLLDDNLLNMDGNPVQHDTDDTMRVMPDALALAPFAPECCLFVSTAEQCSTSNQSPASFDIKDGLQLFT